MQGVRCRVGDLNGPVSCSTLTPNLKPQTLNPKSQIPNPKSQILSANSKQETRNPKPEPHPGTFWRCLKLSLCFLRGGKDFLLAAAAPTVTTVALAPFGARRVRRVAPLTLVPFGERAFGLIDTILWLVSS
jgi:hypothetical protein